jgi:hypothetical protein
MSLTLCRAGRLDRRGKHKTPQLRAYSRFESADFLFDCSIGNLPTMKGSDLPPQLLLEILFAFHLAKSPVLSLKRTLRTHATKRREKRPRSTTQKQGVERGHK